MRKKKEKKFGRGFLSPIKEKVRASQFSCPQQQASGRGPPLDIRKLENILIASFIRSEHHLHNTLLRSPRTWSWTMLLRSFLLFLTASLANAATRPDRLPWDAKDDLSSAHDETVAQHAFRATSGTNSCATCSNAPKGFIMPSPRYQSLSTHRHSWYPLRTMLHYDRSWWSPVYEVLS